MLIISQVFNYILEKQNRPLRVCYDVFFMSCLDTFDCEIRIAPYLKPYLHFNLLGAITIYVWDMTLVFQHFSEANDWRYTFTGQETLLIMADDLMTRQ